MNHLPHRGILFIEISNNQQPDSGGVAHQIIGNSSGVYIINPFICYKKVAPLEPSILPTGKQSKPKKPIPTKNFS